MPCCQRSCTSRCNECQSVSRTPGTRDRHKGHRCGRILHCQHPCSQSCEQGHNDVCGNADCKAPCRQSCSHHICHLGCSEPCTPCVMPCPWKCEHHECSVPCGSVSMSTYPREYPLNLTASLAFVSLAISAAQKPSYADINALRCVGSHVNSNYAANALRKTSWIKLSI